MNRKNLVQIVIKCCWYDWIRLISKVRRVKNYLNKETEKIKRNSSEKLNDVNCRGS